MKLEIGTKGIIRKKESGILPSLKGHSYFFLHVDADIAEYLANSFKEWITEGVDVDGIDTADALNLDQEALDTRNHCPDVQERENGEVNAPDECHRDAKDGGQQAVKPIFCHSEGGKAGLPDAVETVRSLWLCNHVFEVDLEERKSPTVSVNRRKWRHCLRFMQMSKICLPAVCHTIISHQQHLFPWNSLGT